MIKDTSNIASVQGLAIQDTKYFPSKVLPFCSQPQKFLDNPLALWCDDRRVSRSKVDLTLMRLRIVEVAPLC